MTKTIAVPRNLVQWRRDDLSAHFILSDTDDPQAVWGYVEWCQVRGIRNIPGMETVALMAQHYAGAPVYVGPAENSNLPATELFFIKNIDVKSGPPAKVRPGIATVGFHGDIAVHQPWSCPPVEEWRTWFRDGVVHEAARYVYGHETYAYSNGDGWPEPTRDRLACVRNYVSDIACDLPVHMQEGAVIDVGIWDDPVRIRLVEVNCPHSSDWYGADLARIAPLLLV